MRCLLVLQGFVPYKLLDPARLPADARNIKQGHPQEGYKNLLGKQLKFKIAQVGWLGAGRGVSVLVVVVRVWVRGGMLLWLRCSVGGLLLTSFLAQIVWGVSGVSALVCCRWWCCCCRRG